MTDGPHLPLRQAPLVQETEWGRHLLDLRVVACADHVATERAPVTVRRDYKWFTGTPLTANSQPFDRPCSVCGSLDHSWCGMTQSLGHVEMPRSPGSTRDKSYARQVWETVFACLLLVGAGALICWMGHV